ncbi:heterokaryon incompatibility protein-domain-containing protein, partial [Cladorrhinum sp. PSN332]
QLRVPAWHFQLDHLPLLVRYLHSPSNSFLTIMPLKYEYEPLSRVKGKEEIRLVTILPSNTFRSRIKIEISHVPFPALKKDVPSNVSLETPLSNVQNTVPRGWTAYMTLEGRFLYRFEDGNDATWDHPSHYEALSYAWGDATQPTKRIFISNSSFLDVPVSFGKALRQLRHGTEPRRIWIDRICIDQGTASERNMEVKRMRNIYQHAARVVVWLGPECSTSSLALSTLAHLGRQLEVTPGCRFLPSPGCEKPLWHDPHFELPYSAKVWAAIDKLLNRPWFRRVWIVQEIQLAGPGAIVQCGKAKISWHDFRRAVLRLSARGVPVNPVTDGIIHWIKPLCQNNNVGDTLSNLLLLTTGRQCSNPRDKIYGILSLATPDTAAAVEPDYTLSIKEAYKAVVLSDAGHRQRLDLLDHCDNGSTTQLGWPSWVPNWAIDRGNLTLASLSQHVSASGASASDFTNDGDVLEVTGVQHSRVTRFSSKDMNPQAEGPPLPDDLYVPQPRLPLINVYIDLLHLGMLKDGWEHAPNHPTAADVRHTLLEVMNGKNQEYLPSRSAYLKGYKIIHTEGGYLGLAPEATSRGDLVCVFLGSALPKVLRQVEPSGYKILGQCYVYGIMNGEALVGNLEQNWTFKRVTDEWGRWQPSYTNQVTGKSVGPDEGPRLGPLPPEWQSMRPGTTGAHVSCAPGAENLNPWKYTNKREITNNDPRLSANALATRPEGPKLTTFHLI